ncbi:MAG: glycosyl hydrolase, family 30 [Haloplasmataceae bacterium]|jgi:glucosylceramidase|nr:glycosyl hydrolase, family 30 [Haloplasmataceae bacterium]
MKKNISLFISLVLLTALVACTSTNTSTSSSSNTTSSSSNTTTNTNSTTIEATTSTTTDVVIDNREFMVEVYTTLGNKTKLLEKQADLMIKKDLGVNASTTLTLNDTVKYQEIDGFGAALSESSAYLINNLDETKRTQVINDLFSLEEGIGINFVRLPMGASDFALSNFTYNDIPSGTEDLTLSQFSINRDKQNAIPVLKDAFALNSNIKLIGSPWSAPAWMKTSDSLNGGSLKPEYYEVYSNYFVKYIEAYELEGLPIYAITPQNEPLHETGGYPSMKMTVNEQISFIKKLGPTFFNNNIDTKIIAYDHNWDKTDFPVLTLLDKTASNYIAGTAFHCYAGDVENQQLVYNVAKTKGIWFTECSGGEWATDFNSNMSWNMQNLFIGSLNYYSKGVLLWNIALDENFGPKNGGCQDCRGVITVKNDGAIEKNVEYYSIGHFSKFVMPGAYRIEAKLEGNDAVITTAFTNPNGDIVVVLHNIGGSSTNININYDGLNTFYSLPGNGTTTLVINKSST